MLEQPRELDTPMPIRDKAPLDAIEARGKRGREAKLDENDGNLTDLLSELRVLLPTAQLLSAFLITVPFNSGFSVIIQSEKKVFLATFILAIVSLVLLSAPAVQHRMVRPLMNREHFKRLATKQVLLGSVTLSLALVLGAELVLSEVFGHVVGLVAAAFIGTTILLLWWVLPKLWKMDGKL